MAVKILDGRKLSEKILESARKEITKKKLKIGLGVILIGENKVSEAYINQKRIASEKEGIKV